MTRVEAFNRLARAMGRAAMEQEAALVVVYEKALRAAGNFYLRQFREEVVVAAADWIPPAGTASFDTEDALAAAVAQREVAAAAIEETLAAGIGEIGVSWDPERFRVFSPELLGSLAQHAAANFDASARDAMGEVIRESFDQGLSVPDTAKALRGRFDSLSKSGAVMLARTDLISLANGGTFMAARQVFEEGEVRKEWLNAHDARVRPTHDAAGGQVVPMEAPFRVGGFDLMYPGDPQGPPGEVINCRCTFVMKEGVVSRPETQAAAPSVLEEFPAPPKGEMAQQIFGDRKDTEALFTNAQGVYSEARRPLHQAIIAGELKAGRPVPIGQQAETLFLAGGSGAGKSTVRRSLPGGGPSRAVTVDPDGIKELIPEYRQMVEAFEQYAAFGVHEESSALSKQLLKEANDRRMNVIVDGTGDSGPGKFLSKIQDAQALGRKVEVVLVDVPTEVAVARVNARAVKTGRHIAEATVRDIHQKVSARFPEYRQVVDWQLWATEGSESVLVAARSEGVEAIYDAARFQQFLDKADG